MAFLGAVVAFSVMLLVLFEHLDLRLLSDHLRCSLGRGFGHQLIRNERCRFDHLELLLCETFVFFFFFGLFFLFLVVMMFMHVRMHVFMFMRGMHVLMVVRVLVALVFHFGQFVHKFRSFLIRFLFCFQGFVYFLFTRKHNLRFKALLRAVLVREEHLRKLCIRNAYRNLLAAVSHMRFGRL